MIHCHFVNFKGKSLVEKTKSVNQKESFEGSRKDINAALDRICEFTGEMSCVLPPCSIHYQKCVK